MDNIIDEHSVVLVLCFHICKSSSSVCEKFGSILLIFTLPLNIKWLKEDSIRVLELERIFNVL